MSKITETEKGKLREIFARINPSNFEEGGRCSVMQDKDFPYQHAQTPEQIRKKYRMFFESWIEEDIEFLQKQFGL